MSFALDPMQGSLLPTEPFTHWAPDETFHSLLCRYYILSGRGGRRRTLERLFGNASWGARHDFPVQLQSFVDRSNGQLGSAEDIIHSRTILPLFLPFASEEAAQSIVRAMSSKGNGTVSAKLGLLRSDFANGHPLKACPSCMADDDRRFRFSYWHREHQLPGLWACLKHRCLLHVALDPDPTPRDWYLPSMARLAEPAGRACLSELEHGMLIKLASFVLGTISLSREFRFDLPTLRGVLHTRLRERDLMTPAGIVRIELFSNVYFDHWGRLLRLSAPESSLQRRSFMRTAGKMLDQSSSGAHPLLWLTTAALVFESWSEFAKSYHLAMQDTSRLAGGDAVKYAPVPDPRIEGLQHLISEGQSVGSAARQLGIGPSVARRLCVVHGIAPDRVLSNVSVELRQLIVAQYEQGNSQEDIAAGLGVDVTLVRYTLDATPAATLRRKARAMATLRESHRGALLAAVSEHPDLSRARLRLTCQAAYSWLVNNDRVWLESVLPDAKVREASIRVAPQSPQYSLF